MASERIVQAALEQVAENRTTIVIAHRLSTIKRADKIVVLANGKVVQEGTHQSLLQDEEGVYWKLVHAQELALHSANSPKSFAMDEKESYETAEDSEIPLVSEPETRVESEKSQNMFRSFAMLLADQRQNWIGYFVILIAAIGAACK